MTFIHIDPLFLLTSTGLEFAEYKEYSKSPQPFTIFVSIEYRAQLLISFLIRFLFRFNRAYLLMTVHAHLCKTEVIGIIGGTVVERNGRKEGEDTLSELFQTAVSSLNP